MVNWSIVGLLALACFSNATVWLPGKSYTYEYNGWLKAAIPELSEQYAGVHLQAELVVEAESDQTLAIVLRNVEARKFNEEISTTILDDPLRWKNLGEPVTIVGAECLETPVLVNFRGSVFESLSVGNNDPLWCINFKKGLASKVQLQIKGTKGTKGSLAAMENLKAGEMMAYPVMEECVTGECETWYEITDLPEDRVKSEPELIPSPELCKGNNFFQIVKTRDFDKCKRPTIFGRIAPMGWRCALDSAVCGGAKSRVSTQRITACEGRQGELIVQRQVVADIRVVQPYGVITEPMEAKTVVILELKSEGSSKAITGKGRSAGGRTVDSLLFAHTLSQQHGGPVPKPGLTESLRLGGKRMDPRTIQSEIRRLMVEVVRDMESNEFYTNPSHLGVLDKLGMIRRAAAFLNLEELKSVFGKELNMDEDSTPFQVAKDCLVAAGTNPAIMLIKEMIVKNKITGERARQAVAVLPITIKTPTRDILQELFDLLDSKTANEDEQLEVTLALSLATIVHQACVNKTLSRSMYPVAVMGEFCSPSEPWIVRKLVPYLSSRIRKAESNGEKIAFITALSNLGHESIIPILIPIIEGEESRSEGGRRFSEERGEERSGSRRTRSVSSKSSRGLEEEEEELGLSKRSKKKNYGVSDWESMSSGQRGYGGFEYGQEEEEEFDLSPQERRKFGIPEHVVSLNKGILHKYGVSESEIEQLRRGSSGRRGMNPSGGYRSAFEEEEEEYELSPSEFSMYGIPQSETRINKGILKKYNVPEHQIPSFKKRSRASGWGSSRDEEESEIELSAAERRRFNIPQGEKVNKGVLHKYGVPEHEIKNLVGKSKKSGWGSGTEEEEEIELSTAERRRFNIPHGEKVNKGILHKYEVPEHEIKNLVGRSRKSGWGGAGSEDEIELSAAERRRYNIPHGEKINKGVLRKYGMPEREITSLVGKGSKSGSQWSSRFEEEEEEEYELSPMERQKYKIPSHETRLNKGLLNKYGVPEHEMKSMRSKSGSKQGSRRSMYDDEEEEEEFDLSPSLRQHYGIAMYEKVNKGILKMYNIPEHEVSRIKGGKSGSRRGGYEEEGEEEFELSSSQRQRYGVPMHEKLNKGTLRKYNIPEHEVSGSQRGWKSGESDWYQEKQYSGKGKKSFGRKKADRKKSSRKSESWSGEEGEESDITLRAKAVFALQKLAHAHNPKAIHILKSVFFNSNEEPEVRMAALNMLVHGNPAAEVWERIAVGTWFEPSEQVNSFVYTTLATLQTLEDPIVRNMALKAKAVLPLAKPVDLSFFGSSNILTDAHDYSNSEGFIFQTSTFFGNSSYLPNNMYINLNVNTGPLRTPHFLEASLAGRNFDIMIENWFEKFYGKSKSTGGHQELHRIRQMLNIAPRATEASEAFVHMKLFDGIQRFWEVDEDILTDLYSEFSEYFKSRGKDINYRKWIPMRDIQVRAPSEMGIPFLVNIHFKGLTSINGNINATAAGLEADINPTVAFKFVSQIGFDVPFVDKYVAAGVDTHLHMAFPNSFRVKVDPAKGQATAEWEATKGRIDVAHYHVKPFTATKDSLDFTPINHATELKEITVHPSPREITIPLSKHLATGAESDILGLNIFLTHKSDSRHVTKLPDLVTILADIKEGKSVQWLLPENLRMQETKLMFDSSASETKALRVTFDVSVASTTNVAANTVIRTGSERPIESNKGRTIANIMGKMDQEKEQKITSWFEKYSGGVATFVDINAELIGSQNRRVEASFGVGSTFMGHLQKIQLEVGKPQGSKFCIDTELEWPKLTSLKREYYLGADLSTSLNIKAGYGKTCENPTKTVFTVDGKLTRTPEMMAEVNTMSETEECKREENVADMIAGSQACEKARRFATDLDRYEFDIDVSDIPDVLANVSYKVQDFLTYIGGRYMSHNRVDVSNPKKQVKVVLEVSPEETNEMSLKIFKPDSNIFFTGVPMGPVSSALLPVNARLPFVANVLNTVSICAIENTKVSTFDNVVFEAPLSGCDHVIAKDCSGRQKVALLGREEGGNKIATILTENDKITVNAAANVVTVNGKEYTASEDKWVIVKDERGWPMLSIKKSRDGFIETLGQKYGWKISVSPTKILVWGVGFMRGRMCGICGNREGETVSDLMGPRGTVLSSGKHLVASYMLNTPRSCDAREYENVQKEAVREEEQSLRNIPYSGLARAIKSEGVRTRSPLASPVSTMSGSTGCTAFKNKMLTRGGVKCFTKITLPECRPGCKPVNTVEKRVGLHCIQKGRLADKLSQELHSRSLSELRSEEEHVTEKVNVPTSCVEA